MQVTLEAIGLDNLTGRVTASFFKIALIKYFQMINDNRKIEIAKNFIEIHATSVAAWSSDRDPMSDDDHYINVYESLFMGVYGDCYGVNAEYDEEGELIVEATEYEVEVVQFDSVSGRSELFTFDLMGEQTEVASYIEEYGRKGDW